MKFLIRTTYYIELEDYIDKYHALKRFKFKPELRKDYMDRDFEAGFVEIDTIDELVKIMNTIDQSLILFPFNPNSDNPFDNTPVIEIYDEYRE